jgi:hypothetical protein
MTDITSTSSIIARTTRPLRLELPKLAIGQTLGAMARAVGEAFEMGYSAPYQVARRHAEAPRDEQGRDPGW